MADLMERDISVVIPTYQGEALLAPVLSDIEKTLASSNFEIILINDGGSDNSRYALEVLCESFSHARLINLDENQGQQAATMAGVLSSLGRVIVTIDDDGEQNPEHIPLLIDKLHQGYDLVYGIPKGISQRKNSSFATFKWGSKIRNRLFSSLLGAPRGLGVSSFRCFTRKIWIESQGKAQPHFIYLSAILFSVKPRVTAIPLDFKKHQGSRYNVRKRIILFVKLFWYYGLKRGKR